jgi:hypothetical protein
VTAIAARIRKVENCLNPDIVPFLGRALTERLNSVQSAAYARSDTTRKLGTRFVQFRDEVKENEASFERSIPMKVNRSTEELLVSEAKFHETCRAWSP